MCKCTGVPGHACRYMWRPEDNTGIFPQELCSSFSHLHVSLCVTVSHWPGVHWSQALGIHSLPFQCYQHVIVSNFSAWPWDWTHVPFAARQALYWLNYRPVLYNLLKETSDLHQPYHLFIMKTTKFLMNC